MQVFVTVYKQDFAQQVRAFRTSESAFEYRRELADAMWNELFGDNVKRPDDREKMAQVFWDASHDILNETFTINVCNVED